MMRRVRLALLLTSAALVGVAPVSAAPGHFESNPAHHGGEGGHLPGSRENVELVGRVDIESAAPDRVADVSAWGSHAYLTVRDPTGCSVAGVAVIDISDPTAPEQVGFIDATEGSQPGEGSQVVELSTRSFRGRVLVFNNEVCGEGGEGGVSLWDVTDPRRPVVLTAHAGDPDPAPEGRRFHEIHSAFAWQAGDRAFVVTVDIEEDADVDILEITDPRHPVFLTEVNLDEFGVLQELGTPLGAESFLHDLIVERVDGTWTMLASYWDGGWVLLDVDDPAEPIFLRDSNYPLPEPLTGLAPPTGNAHQAEFSTDRRFIIGTNEDFSPYRLDFLITGGPHAGPYPAGEFGWTVPTANLPGNQLRGPVVYGGLGCPGGEPVPDASPLPAEAGEHKIVVLLRGTCFFSQKVEAAQQAGYDVAIVANDHANTDAGASPDAFACGGKGHEFTVTIAGLCIGHRAFHLLFATEPAYSDPADAPPIGTRGATVAATAKFDGWGDVRLLDTATMRELDAYAIPQALDPVFASGFGNLTVHEVAVDPFAPDLAYLSYYAGGLRVISYGEDGMKEVGHYIDPGGNDFWGVEVHRLPLLVAPLEALGEPLILASDRDTGLWIFRYTD